MHTKLSLLDGRNVDKDFVRALKMKFRGRNNSKRERKHSSFTVAAYFIYTASQMDTLLECVQACYWHRPTSVAQLVAR